MKAEGTRAAALPAPPPGGAESCPRASETGGGAVARGTETPPLPENPYHRVYTKNRSFEELARRKRQAGK